MARNKTSTGLIPLLVFSDILIIGSIIFAMVHSLVPPKSSNLAILTVTPNVTVAGPTIWLGLFHSCVRSTNSSPITCSKLVRHARYDFLSLEKILSKADITALTAVTPSPAVAAFFYLALCIWFFYLLSSYTVIGHISTATQHYADMGRSWVKRWLKCYPIVLLFIAASNGMIYLNLYMVCYRVGEVFNANNSKLTASAQRLYLGVGFLLCVAPVVLTFTIHRLYRNFNLTHADREAVEG